MESHVGADCSFLFNLPQRRKMLIHNGTEVHINEEDTKENSRSLNTCKPICNNLQDHTAHQTQKYHFCKCVPNFLILKDSSLLLENCLWLECKDSLQHTFSSSKVVAGTIRFHLVPSHYVRQGAKEKQSRYFSYYRIGCHAVTLSSQII